MRCSTCGADHEWTELGYRAHCSNDDCRIRDAADTERRYFLRALMPVPVRGAPRECCWGLWVEVSAATFDRVGALWDAPDQAAEPSFVATVANAVRGYPPTLGLPGGLQLTGPTTPPQFLFEAGVDHPLAEEQRSGVYPERILEWLHDH